MHSILSNLIRRQLTKFADSNIYSSRSKLSTLSVSKLSSRSVISVDGPDSIDYLQGLITNDVNHLSDNQTRCIYAFMLNHLGRIMADILVYRTDKDSMLVECDSQVVNTVHKNLIIHKLKKKVSVKMRQDMNVYAIFPDTESQPSSPTVGSSSHDHVLTADPRLPSMCLHRLVSREANFDDLRKDMNTLGMISDRSELDYRLFRYRIGLGEGHLDHPSGSAFPLESNGDYLHGISFFKGCYVGQELTARTYHTGVTRKRIMPVELASSGVISVEPDSRLTSADGKKRLGKMRSANGHLGLALVYHEEIAKHDYTLYHQDTALRTKRPSWWPKTERDKMAEKIDSS